MNRVDVPRETAARRPLIRSQTRFSPPLPPILPDNETRHYHARPDNVYSRDPLIVPISSKPLFRDPTTPNPTFPRILFFQKFYLHEIFVRPINSMMKDTRLTLSRQERERERVTISFSPSNSPPSRGEISMASTEMFSLRCDLASWIREMWPASTIAVGQSMFPDTMR